MELFKELSELGYKHYTENTVEELDSLQLSSEERIMEQALVFRWFREKYGLEGVVQRSEDFVWYKWKISQYNEDSKKYVADWYEYEAYEEAELACLRKMIEVVKKEKQA